MTKNINFEDRNQAAQMLSRLGAVLNDCYVEPCDCDPDYPTCPHCETPLNGFFYQDGTIHTVNEDYPQVREFQSRVISGLMKLGFRVYDSNPYE